MRDRYVAPSPHMLLLAAEQQQQALNDMMQFMQYQDQNELQLGEQDADHQVHQGLPLQGMVVDAEPQHDLLAEGESDWGDDQDFLQLIQLNDAAEDLQYNMQELEFLSDHELHQEVLLQDDQKNDRDDVEEQNLLMTDNNK